ncbi:MAG TPA: hypothetical protein VKE53_13730 [Pseudolabrys sp.]|nr:hypothetical protein [Pseudolabrys sp.]
MKLCSIGISLVVSCAFAHNALAQMDLSTAANVAADVARGAVNTLTAGPKGGGRVIKGENPVRVIKDVANDRIEILIKPNEVVAGADQKIENHVKSALPKKLGQTVEISRLPEKLSKQAPIVLSRTAQDVLDTGKVGNVIGVPLAIGVRQAVALYQDRAKPIPADIRFYLTGLFSKEILERAQFVIDDNVGSYGIINKFQEACADNHAVTADNIIVFAKPPSSKDIWFWAHEMQHTVQYKNLGIDGFAAKYTTDSSAMENEANRKGDQAVDNYNEMIRLMVTLEK